MKKVLILCIVLLGAIVLNAEILDKIVAKVGNEIILLSDVQKQMMQMQSAKMLPPNVTAMDVLDQMIENRLIIQKARDMGIVVDEARIRSFAERYLNQIKANYPSEADFIRELRSAKLTQSDLLKYYTDLLRENALSEQLVEREITGKIFISERDLRSFYESTKDTLAVRPMAWNIGLIMREIKPSEQSKNQILGDLKSILQRLNSGADFAIIAMEESDCPSGQAGGDLGFFRKGQMVEPFEKAAFALNVGEISGIVETQFGYHIIKVDAIRGNEIAARHILKMLSPTTADSLRENELMQSIRRQYQNGTPFAELAREWSMDTDSAEKGGIIGEFTATELPELFATVLEALPVGGITEVLNHEGMLYLFLKESQIPSRLFSFEEIKPQIQNYLTRQKQMEMYETWIDQLKRDNYVEITL